MLRKRRVSEKTGLKKNTRTSRLNGTKMSSRITYGGVAKTNFIYLYKWDSSCRPPSLPPLHSTHTLRSIRQSTGLGVPNEGTTTCKTFITKRKYLRLDFSLIKRTACMKTNTYVKTTLASIEQLTNRWYSEIGSVSSSMIFFSSTRKNIRKKMQDSSVFRV